MELQTIFKLLTGAEAASDLQWQHRLAPSIVVRGEAEMMALADPRFALRVLLRDHESRCIGLVNVRRLRRIIPQLNHPHGFRALHKVSSIADSYLIPPKEYRGADWIKLSLDPSLFVHLGESIGICTELSDALPYLRQIDIIGGGLCAQACCFMATLLLYKWTKSVVSIPDITMLARSGKSATGSLALSGLTPSEICKYFEAPSIGLCATKQYFKYGSNAFKDGMSQLKLIEMSQRLAKMIRAYIRSGFPVMVRVDAGRMRGKNSPFCPLQPRQVYFFSERSRTSTADCSARHVILLVGVHEREDRFIAFDTATHPFVKLSAEDIFRNSTYVFNTSDPEHIAQFGEELDIPLLIPVTPSTINVPLLDIQEEVSTADGSNSRFGLIFESRTLNIAEVWRVNAPNEPELGQVPPLCDHEYYLSNLAGLSPDILERLANLSTDEVSVLSSKISARINNDHWIWFQLANGLVVVWDAQTKLDSDAGYQVLLIGIRYSGGWRWLNLNTQNDSSSTPAVREALSSVWPYPELSTTGRRKVSYGAVTSCFPDGIASDQFRLCPNGIIEYFELYAFMHQELRKLAPERTLRSWFALARKVPRLLDLNTRLLARSIPIRFNHNRIGSPLYFSRKPVEPNLKPLLTVEEWLAVHSDDQTTLRKIAKSVTNFANEKPITAIATFFPCISSLDDERRLRSIAALKAVSLMSKEIGVIQGQSVKVIEFVAGSRLYGHHIKEHKPVIDHKNRCRFREDEDDVYCAEVASKETAFRQLEDSIRSVLVSHDPATKLALELEPGELFTVNQLNDLERMCDFFDELNTLNFRIGFNCDLGHWTLASRSGRCNKVSERVLNQIVHVHASDLGKGHFCDLSLGYGIVGQDARKWIDLIRGLDPTQFFGDPILVSVEMELAVEMRQVLDSINMIL